MVFLKDSLLNMLEQKKDFLVYMEHLLVFWLDLLLVFGVGVEEGEIDGFFVGSFVGLPVGVEEGEPEGFLVENVGETEGVPGL